MYFGDYHYCQTHYSKLVLFQQLYLKRKKISTFKLFFWNIYHINFKNKNFDLFISDASVKAFKIKLLKFSR